MGSEPTRTQTNALGIEAKCRAWRKARPGRYSCDKNPPKKPTGNALNIKNMKKYFALFAAALFFNAMLHAQKPQEPQPTDAYHAQDVSFMSPAGNVKLSGTFTYPKNKKVSAAVILLSGSGPQDRDSELLGHKPFLVLADDLTKKGIAVLRVDDRGAGESQGDYNLSGMADFVADARAAMAYLKTRPEVDKRRMGLIGHSLGAAVAAIVAADSKDVAFIAMLGGSGVRGDKVMLTQKAAIERKMGVNEAAIAIGQQSFGGGYDIIVGSDKDAAGLQADLVAYFKSVFGSAVAAAQLEVLAQQLAMPWLADFIRFDPAQVLPKVKCPIFAAIGSNDMQIIAGENLEAIRQLTKENPNVTVREMPGLNHLFQTSTTGMPQEYATIEETLSPKLLEDLSGWILNLTKK